MSVNASATLCRECKRSSADLVVVHPEHGDTGVCRPCQVANRWQVKRYGGIL